MVLVTSRRVRSAAFEIVGHAGRSVSPRAWALIDSSPQTAAISRPEVRTRAPKGTAGVALRARPKCAPRAVCAERSRTASRVRPEGAERRAPAVLS